MITASLVFAPLKDSCFHERKNWCNRGRTWSLLFQDNAKVFKAGISFAH